ncbi:MAG: hypothetical protein AB7N76_16355 [Planctomycetota bacterium]
MEDRKPLLIGMLVIVAVGVFFGLPKLNWFRFELAMRDAMSDKGIGRFPTPQQMLELSDKVKAEGKAKGFADLTTSLRLEERPMPPVKFWYLQVTMRSGSHELMLERRVETQLGDEELDVLRQGGCEVKLAE